MTRSSGIGWDTDIGGRKREFPSTCWSRLLDGFAGDADQSRAAAEELAKGYWKPIYAYIRATWARSNDDAKDLTQEFFIWMSESDFLSKADPARGRFRAFVKVALDRFLGMDERRRQAVKRGGGRIALPLEEAPALLAGLGIADRSQLTPEETLDDAWRNELLGRAASRLEADLEAEGKRIYFEVFRDYHLGEREDLDYRAVAERHGIAPKDVDNYLLAAKKRFRALLESLVAETVRSDEDLHEELRFLFGDVT